MGITSLGVASKKGLAGEHAIGKILDGTGCRFIHDFHYINKNDEVCQIDFLVFLGNAIGVIEVKNYSGYISGMPDEREWIQQIWSKKIKLRGDF